LNERVLKKRVLAFANDLGPAIVTARDDAINLVVANWAVLRSEEFTRDRMPVQPLGIAVAVGVDWRVWEGIVRGYGAIRVNAQDLARQGV
jgi:hypothetical protein